MGGTTYLNAYEILTQVRYDLNEYSSGYVQGTDTSGSWQNALLMKKINDAQRYIWQVLFKHMPELFLTNTTLTGSSSVYTLPFDFFRIKRFEDSDGYKIRRISVDDKHNEETMSSEHLYYLKGSTLRIDANGLSDSMTLWYYSRPRELDQGSSTAGGALSLTLAATAKKIADYYNGMTIENVTDDWTDTISDYTAARVCTLAAQTGASSKYYGIVSELPEPFHHLIPIRAAMLCKALPQSPFPLTPADAQLFDDNMRETMAAYAGTAFIDVPMEDIFCDFGPNF